MLKGLVRRMGDALDEQVVPALHLHDIPPVDVLLWSLRRRAGRRRRLLVVRLKPELAEQAGNATKAARVGKLAELRNAILKEGAE